MKLKYILFALVIAVLQFSCYEDKGNYDYKDLNNIDIDFGDMETSVVLGDVLKIEPNFTFALGTESTDLSYLWTVGNRKISEQRNLEWTADTIMTYGNLELRVLDKSTGVTYLRESSITVKSPYASKGWIILSEKPDGTTSFSFLREGTKTVDDKKVVDYVPHIDVYKTENKSEAGTGPIKVLEHFTDLWEGEDTRMGRFWVIQKGAPGPIQISGRSFLRTKTLEESFRGKVFPQGFVPYDMIDMKWITLAVSENGKIYTRKKETFQLFNTGEFLDQPLRFEGKDVDGRNLIWGPYADIDYTLMYDKPNNRYLVIYDKSQVEAGTVQKITVSANQYEAQPEFSRLDNLGDKEVVFCGMKHLSGEYLSLLRSKTTNNLYVQQFSVGGIAYEDYPAGTLGSQRMVNLAPAVDGTTQNVFNLSRFSRAPYLYIGKGGELWVYNVNSDAANALHKFYTFGQKIVSIDSETYGGDLIVVGLENGDVYVVSTTTKLVNASINGTLASPDEMILGHVGGFGKIVQVRIKTGEGNGWNVEWWE